IETTRSRGARLLLPLELALRYNSATFARRHEVQTRDAERVEHDLLDRRVGTVLALEPERRLQHHGSVRDDPRTIRLVHRLRVQEVGMSEHDRPLLADERAE